MSVSWTVAYGRLRHSPDFQRYFPGPPVLNQRTGKNEPAPLPPHAFRALTYIQKFTVAPQATVGPAQQNFPAGATVLGIKAGCYQDQTTAGAFTYAPSFHRARLDLFEVNYSYTNDELITPGGPGNAAAIQGDGAENEFPQTELLIPPSQGILATIFSRAPAGAPDLQITIAYHCMVPRAVG